MSFGTLSARSPTKLSPHDSRDLAVKLSNTAQTLHHRFIGINSQLHSLTLTLASLPSSPQFGPQGGNHSSNNNNNNNNNQTNEPQQQSHTTLHQQQMDILNKYSECGDENDLLDDLDLNALSQSISRNPSLFDPLNSRIPQLGEDGRLVKIDEKTEHSINQLKKDVELLLTALQSKQTSTNHHGSTQPPQSREFLHDLLHMMTIMYTVDDATYNKHYDPLCRYFHDFLFHPNSTRHLLFTQSNTSAPNSNTYHNNNDINCTINSNNTTNNNNTNNNNNANNNTNTTTTTNNNNSNDNNNNNNDNDNNTHNDPIRYPAPNINLNAFSGDNSSDHHHNRLQNDGGAGVLSPTRMGCAFSGGPLSSDPSQSLFDLPTRGSTNPQSSFSGRSNGQITNTTLTPTHTQQRSEIGVGSGGAVKGGPNHPGQSHSQNTTPRSTPTHSRAADDSTPFNNKLKSQYGAMINPVVKSNRRTQQGDSEMEAMFDSIGPLEQSHRNTHHHSNKKCKNNNPSGSKKNTISDNKSNDMASQHSKYDSDNESDDFSGASDDETEQMFKQIESGNFPTPQPKAFVLDPSMRDSFLQRNLIDRKAPNGTPTLIPPNVSINLKGNKTPKEGYVVEFIPSAKHRVEHLNDDSLEQGISQHPLNQSKVYADDIDDLSESESESESSNAIQLDPTPSLPQFHKNNNSGKGGGVTGSLDHYSSSSDPFATSDDEGEESVTGGGVVEEEEDQFDSNDGDDDNYPRNRKSTIPATPAHHVPAGIEFRNGRWVRSATVNKEDESDDPFSSGDETALDDIPDFDTPEYNATKGVSGSSPQKTSHHDDDLSGDESDDDYDPEDSTVPQSPEPLGQQRPPSHHSAHNLGHPQRGSRVLLNDRKPLRSLPTFDKNTLKNLIEEEEELRTTQSLIIPGPGGVGSNMPHHDSFTQSGQFESKNGSIIGDPVTRRQSITGREHNATHPSSNALSPLTGSLSATSNVPIVSTLLSPAPAIIRAMTHVVVDEQNSKEDLPEFEGLQIDDIHNRRPVVQTDLPGADVLDALSLSTGSNASSRNIGPNNLHNDKKTQIKKVNDDWKDDVEDMEGFSDDDNQPRFIQSNDGKNHLASTNTRNVNNHIGPSANGSFKLLQMTPEEVAKMVEAQTKGLVDNKFMPISNNINTGTLSHSQVLKLNADGDDSDPFADMDDEDEIIKPTSPPSLPPPSSSSKKLNISQSRSPTSSYQKVNVPSDNSKVVDKKNTQKSNKHDPHLIPKKNASSLTDHKPSQRSSSHNSRKPPLSSSIVPFDLDEFGDDLDDDDANEAAIKALKTKIVEKQQNPNAIVSKLNSDKNDDAKKELFELELPNDLKKTLFLTEQFHFSSFGAPFALPTYDTSDPVSSTDDQARRGRSPNVNQ